jgi:hypothetical protein
MGELAGELTGELAGELTGELTGELKHSGNNENRELKGHLRGLVETCGD